MIKPLEFPQHQSPQTLSRFGRFLHWFKTPHGRRTINGYLFISPFILGVMFWVLYPALMAAWLSFQEWNLITPAKFLGSAGDTIRPGWTASGRRPRRWAGSHFVSVPLG